MFQQVPVKLYESGMEEVSNQIHLSTVFLSSLRRSLQSTPDGEREDPLGGAR